MDCPLARLRAFFRAPVRAVATSLSLCGAALLVSACSSLNPYGSQDPVFVPTGGELSSQNQRASGLLERGKNQLNGGQGAAAEDSFDDLLDLYPFSSSAAEAQFLLGESLRVQGKYEKAVEAYQQVLTRHPNSGRFSNSLESIFNLAEAAQRGEIKTSFLGLDRNYDQADIITWHESIVRAAPRSPLAPKSLLTLGQLYAEDFQRSQATQTLQRLVREYPNSAEAPQAQLLIADVISGAGRETNESRSLRGSQGALEDLDTMFGDDDPEIAQQARDRLDEINTSQAANDLKIAQFYERKGNMRAATLYYREVLRYKGTREFDIAQARLTDFGVDEGPLGEGADAQLRQLAAQGRILTSDRADFVGPSAPQLVSADNQGSLRGVDPLILENLPDLDQDSITRGASGIVDNPLFGPIEEEERNQSSVSTLPDLTPEEVEAAGNPSQTEPESREESPEETRRETQESSEELLRRAREKLRRLQQSTQEEAENTSPSSERSPSTESSQEAATPSSDAPTTEDTPASEE